MSETRNYENGEAMLWSRLQDANAENAALREENERLTAANKARAEYLTTRRAGNDVDSYVNLAETKIEELRARLAELERNEGTLLGMIRHQQDVLRECLPYVNESMAGRRPGRSADDIRAAVKALTTDSASAVQPERCCLDYPRCDCNSPPEPDDDWLCFQRPAQPKVTP